MNLCRMLSRLKESATGLTGLAQSASMCGTHIESLGAISCRAVTSMTIADCPSVVSIRTWCEHPPEIKQQWIDARSLAATAGRRRSARMSYNNLYPLRPFSMNNAWVDFFKIQFDPGREDLPFFLEKESRLGEIYAGVLVDHTQAGVEHSLRWDVLSVRIPGGKQHAKLTLLSWNRCIRLIVASANLTEPGYRSNYEVADAIDLVPDDIDFHALAAAVEFLRCLLLLVPRGSQRPPGIQRAEAFLEQVERQVEGWKSVRSLRIVRQRLVFTLPAIGPDRAARTKSERLLGLVAGVVPRLRKHG